MKRSYRIVTGVSIVAACAVPLLTGCGKSTNSADTSAGTTSPTAAANAAMPEQARTIAAQHAQGAEFDAKRRAAAMAKTVPANK